MRFTLYERARFADRYNEAVTELFIPNMLPFKWSPFDDLYCHVVPSETRELLKATYNALKELPTEHKVIKNGENFALVAPREVARQYKEISDNARIMFYGAMPNNIEYFPYVGHHLNRLPSTIDPEIIEWTERFLALHSVRLQSFSIVKEVINTVNTIGQLVRIWPDLFPFAPPKLKKAYTHQKAKSSISKIVLRNADNEDVTIEEFQKTSDYESISHILATMVLLLDDKNFENVEAPRGYPKFIQW